MGRKAQPFCQPDNGYVPSALLEVSFSTAEHHVQGSEQPKQKGKGGHPKVCVRLLKAWGDDGVDGTIGKR